MIAGGGSCEVVDGLEVCLLVEPDGWLVGSTPLDGAPDGWFARQSRILTLAKIVPGPALLAELPIREAPADEVPALKAVLREALATLADGDPTTAADRRATAAADREAGEILAVFAASSPWPVTQAGNALALVVETARGRQQRVSAAVLGGRLRVAARLGPPPGEAASERAITSFLLALNERVRLARGRVSEAGVEVEVVLPSNIVNVEILDRAMGALVVAAAMASRECAALLDPAVAEVFSACHRVAPRSAEPAGGARIRASRRERSKP
jgi:hypothetical protein